VTPTPYVYPREQAIGYAIVAGVLVAKASNDWPGQSDRIYCWVPGTAWQSHGWDLCYPAGRGRPASRQIGKEIHANEPEWKPWETVMGPAPVKLTSAQRAALTELCNDDPAFGRRAIGTLNALVNAGYAVSPRETKTGRYAPTDAGRTAAG
jgi:hypothetical protein